MVIAGWAAVDQLDLFVTDHDPQAKPVADQVQRLNLLITVKAAPQPSAAYGETVCVAGISTDLATSAPDVRAGLASPSC